MSVWLICWQFPLHSTVHFCQRWWALHCTWPVVWTAVLLLKMSSQEDSSDKSVEEVKSTSLPPSFSVLSEKSDVRRKGHRDLVCLNSRWQQQVFLAPPGICTLDSNCYKLSSSMIFMQSTNTNKSSVGFVCVGRLRTMQGMLKGCQSGLLGDSFLCILQFIFVKDDELYIAYRPFIRQRVQNVTSWFDGRLWLWSESVWEACLSESMLRMQCDRGWVYLPQPNCRTKYFLVAWFDPYFTMITKVTSRWEYSLILGQMTTLQNNIQVACNQIFWY